MFNRKHFFIFKLIELLIDKLKFQGRKLKYLQVNPKEGLTT